MAAGFELKIITDLSMMPKVVETNIDEVKPVIDAAIAKLDGLVVTDNKDDIIAADADAAKLRKMSDAIKRFRLDHIALWKTPMEDFETKCKAAEKRLTEAATSITAKTGEVKELWRNRKREKYQKLWAEKVAEAFDEHIQSCDHVSEFFKHWTDPKTKGTWVNSSVSESSVVAAMDAEIERMKQGVEAVKANYGEQSEEVQAKARYALYKAFDLNDVICEVNRWKAEQKAIAEAAEAERKRQAEKQAAMEQAKRDLAARRAAEEANRVVEAEAAARGAEAAAAPAQTPTAPAPAEAQDTQSGASDGKGDAAPVETYRLAVTGTREALMNMKAYGLKLGIAFKNLDNE